MAIFTAFKPVNFYNLSELTQLTNPFTAYSGNSTAFNAVLNNTIHANGSFINFTGHKPDAGFIHGLTVSLGQVNPVAAYSLGGVSLSFTKLLTDLASKPILEVWAGILSGGDSIKGSNGADSLLGFDGADSVGGGGGNDTILGGKGHDTIDGGSGKDLIFGQADADNIHGGLEADFIEGGDGEDQLYGDNGDDQIYGGASADSLQGGVGKDYLDGGLSIDSVRYYEKTAGISVTLAGATSVSVKVNGVVEDTIKNFENVVGGQGADTITGDGAANFIHGHGGKDKISGAGGNDHLQGGAGNDTVNGGAGNDKVWGGGADTIDGSIGSDTLTGGSGKDTFVFVDGADSQTNVDTVTDFKVGEDIIYFSASHLYGEFVSVPDDFLAIGSSAKKSGQHIIYNATTGNLFFDTDGNGGKVSPVLVAHLSKNLALSEKDFDFNY